MNIEFLKTFITLAGTGSFTRTAQNYMVVQPTISSRIRELENEVGQKLFVRTHNHIKLTPAGEIFLRYAEKIVRLESAAVKQTNLAGKYADLLTIGVVHSLYDCHVEEYMLNFTVTQTDLAFRLKLGHSRQIISDIGSGFLDIGFTYRKFNHPGYACELFKEDDIVFVTGSQNGAYPDGVSVGDIQALPIYYSDFLDTNTHNWIFPDYYQYPLEIDVGTKVIPFLQKHERYSFLPRKLVEKSIQAGHIREIQILNENLPSLQSYIIYKLDNEKSSIIQSWLQQTEMIASEKGNEAKKGGVADHKPEAIVS